MGLNDPFAWRDDDGASRQGSRRPREELDERELMGSGEVEDDVPPGPWRNLRRAIRGLKDAEAPFSGVDFAGVDPGDAGEGCGTVIAVFVVLVFGAVVGFLLLMAVLDIVAAVIAVLAVVAPVLLRRVRDLARSLHGWRLVLTVEGAVIVAMLVVLAVRRLH